jgi:hypothetical protein
VKHKSVKMFAKIANWITTLIFLQNSMEYHSSLKCWIHVKLAAITNHRLSRSRIYVEISLSTGRLIQYRVERDLCVCVCICMYVCIYEGEYKVVATLSSLFAYKQVRAILFVVWSCYCFMYTIAIVHILRTSNEAIK